MDQGSTLASLEAFLQSPRTSYPGARGTVHLWEPSPRVVVTKVVGVLTVEGGQAIEMATRRASAKSGQHIQFHDWEEQTDYEAEARAKLTNVALELSKHIERLHILARSTVVRLGLKAASLVLRSLKMHDDRARFEAELRRALGARRA
jgi:hypothetical protein